MVKFVSSISLVQAATAALAATYRVTDTIVGQDFNSAFSYVVEPSRTHGRVYVSSPINILKAVLMVPTETILTRRWQPPRTSPSLPETLSFFVLIIPLYWTRMDLEGIQLSSNPTSHGLQQFSCMSFPRVHPVAIDVIFTGLIFAICLLVAGT
jgi:hypothetical protein